MKSVTLFLLFIACVSCQIIARAVVYGTAQDPTVTGYVLFSQGADGNVTVSVNLNGIVTNPNALHGIHIHSAGDLSDEISSLSTLGHYNPFNSVHGCPEINGTNRHAGDMGNWQATNGSIVQTKVLDLLQLTGNASIVGRAVVLHQLQDDCVAVWGSRLAHGVVGTVNTTVYGGTAEALQQSTAHIPAAVCVLKPTTGNNVTGQVWFFQSSAGAPVDVYAQIQGITGEHGFHLHWWGDVSAPNGVATGGHYNPYGVLHGIPPAHPRHVGDMGIISHYNNGVAYYQYSNSLLTLNGQYNVVGRAVHVHANSDDCSDPVGSGGARWAQCVIGITTNTTLPIFPAGVPTTQNGIEICSALRGTSASSGASSGATTAATTAATSAATTDAGTTSEEEPSDVANLVASFVVVFAMLLLSF